MGESPEPDDAEERHVDVMLCNDGVELRVSVHDNGRGLPDGFSIEATTSLGLSIVRDLVTGQLAGQIRMRSDGGTLVEMRIPVNRE